MRRRLQLLLALLAVLWILEVVDQLFLGRSLDAYGIRPRSPDGLWGILLSPFLHGGFGHLAGNTVPFLVLGWFVLLMGIPVFVEVVILVVLLSGFGTWLIGAPNSIHIGASGLIFGFLGFLLLSGFFEHSVRSVLVAVIVGVLHGGLMWGVLPRQPGVSWEGHLSGFVAGAVTAWLMARFAQSDRT